MSQLQPRLSANMARGQATVRTSSAVSQRQFQVIRKNRAACGECFPIWFLLVWALFVERVSGWEDCSISPLDEWKEATAPSLAMRMREQYDRYYTCTSSEKGSYMAAKYFFDSACLARRFITPPDVHECLKGRRVIFLGDSLSNQQGDSLLGMLGWNPAWMPIGGPNNSRKVYGEDGEEHYSLVDCWHTPDDRIRGIERCYDQFSADFPPPHEASFNSGKPHTTITTAAAVTTSDPAESHNTGERRAARRVLREEEEGEGEKEGGGGEVVDNGYSQGDDQRGGEEIDKGEDAISVHVRMASRPLGENWFNRAIRDYNETRASDVIVVNFGAHYRANPQGDEDFKQDVFPLLDEMANLGEKATVIWREISPVHFPSHNGSYDTFVDLNLGNTACCTGTPSKVLDRNMWVDNYLRDNGLSDRIKVLRIYDMSFPRGAAHHTCNAAPPSTMDQTGAKDHYCHSKAGTDCAHWSETGVVEEWNALLLNHICPAE